MLNVFANLAALVLVGSPAVDDSARIASLIQTFRQTTTLRAHFREEKHMAILAAPLTSEGDLFFSAPDRLSRRVTQPSPSQMVIDGSHLSFSEGHGVQSVPLEQNPVARMFVDSFIKILAGDQVGLAKLYEIALTAQGANHWELSLTPKAAPLNQLVQVIAISGQGTVLRQMRIREADGDETVTTFSAVELGRPFTAEEQRRDFGF